MGQEKSSKLSPMGETEGAIKNMKKNYVSPLATEVTLETTQMLASSLSICDADVNTDENGVQLGGGRRGTWGDVWK